MTELQSPRAWFIGDGTLLLRCVQLYAKHGGAVAGVTTTDAAIRQWAEAAGIASAPLSATTASAIRDARVEYLISVGNFTMLQADVLAAPARAAINFHYGPLPDFAGVHVPVWALLEGASRYGVTWHEMTAGVDAGRILVEQMFDVPDNETAEGLTTRIFEAGLQSFSTVLASLQSGSLTWTPQDFARRRVFRRDDRPTGHALIDWHAPAETTARLVRALDFGRMENSFAVARLLTPHGALIVTTATSASDSTTTAHPGTILASDEHGITVATTTAPLVIRGLRRLTGDTLSLADAIREYGLRAGVVLRSLTAADHLAVRPAFDAATTAERRWVARLAGLAPLAVPYATPRAAGQARAERISRTITLAGSDLTALGRETGADATTVLVGLVAAFLARVSEEASAVTPVAVTPAAAATATGVAALLSDFLPLRTRRDQTWSDVLRDAGSVVESAVTGQSFFVDACARYPGTDGLSHLRTWPAAVAVHPGAPTTTNSADLAIVIDSSRHGLTLDAAADRYAPAALERFDREFRTFVTALAAHPETVLGSVSLLDADERARMLVDWNRTDRPVPAACIHELFELQVARTPDAIAVRFRDQSLTYRDLNHHANFLAARLRALGIGPDRVVGVFVDRSLEMVVALFGILKAGGAYLPLDPAFPQERLTWMLEDTKAPVVVTQPHLTDTLPRHHAHVVSLDVATTAHDESANIAGGVSPANLAYVIFTSGSTGRPKGVMVEHRQVINFFVGMDEYLGGGPAGTWLAVTSISFDISVLELFWTLARGYTVVVQEELIKAAGQSLDGTAGDDRGMEFSLFYFSADARGDGGNRYRLLLEGAKYADANGFRAIWTPERHFHEFGGLYPNPAVTSAAIATITSRIRVRAGSVVLPLHHPIRVAEEWAVVDQLSNGRVELSFASGWHANDFALAPDNYQSRREVMLAGIDTIRRLWRGEAVAATNGHGEPIEVRVYPAPLQTKPAFWIAAAGNIETFTLAGRIGAHLLTNLLGQKIEDVATKIAAYRAAWREAGHAGDGVVALMLHTFVGPNLDAVRETVKRPLIEYLKTSTELVKKARWEFPAFANPSGKHAPAAVDLTPEEIDAMMEHAFDRYFDTSGLFGTPEMCVERVRAFKAIGVDEIACLLDFGIATDTVLAHLPYLNQVRERTQSKKATGGDYTIAAQIARHGVTHLQGTPSLIRTILADERGRSALSELTTLLVGGEPLPPALAADVLPLLPHGTLLNMYGPTETTVWSTVARITDAQDITIGRPIANTQVYVVDRGGQPQPVGVAGELLIGGAGVTRGYWQRPDLTRERFVTNPHLPDRGGSLYRTGDLARYRADGRLECLGRIDHQVKVSGHRIELGEIEAVINAHPSASQAVVVVRPDASGESRLVAYVVPKSGAGATSSGDLSQWQAIWDETYGGIGRPAGPIDPTFDISGWRNSFTGDLMPAEEMREWVDATVGRILALEPRRVLEIGCGTGLLLHRLAPVVEHYTAIDFSPTAIARVQASVDSRGLSNVTLRSAAADTVSSQRFDPVDVVVINSVVQYFPDAEYLVRVIGQAIEAVRNGGAVFIGDVRNLTWLEAFHTAIELAQAPAGMASVDLRHRVRDRVQHDPELVLAPGFFEAVRAAWPAITDVDIQLKRGRAHNEMTQFRYDVVLRVGRPRTRPAVPDVQGRGLSLRDVQELVAAGRSVAIRGIANPRLATALEAVRLLDSADCPETVGGVRHHLGAQAPAGIEPEDLIAAAAGWNVRLDPGDITAPGSYDATLLAPDDTPVPAPLPAPSSASATREHVHRPPQDRGQTVQSIKQHLRARLPAYMVPSAFVLLDTLPLTPNGKIDRARLPEPDRQRHETTSAYVAPSNEVEQVLAETWQDLLALDRVGLHDNFFDLGANSLLMVQAHSVLKDKLQRPLSLVDLFRYPTIATLAGFLGQGDHAAASAALSASEARAQARVDALSRRRQSRTTGRSGSATEKPTR